MSGGASGARVPDAPLLSPQDQVEKLLLKQASMQEMFDKRRVSLKKLAAKQTRPVQPVAPRPEAFTKSPLTSPGELALTHTHT